MLSRGLGGRAVAASQHVGGGGVLTLSSLVNPPLKEVAHFTALALGRQFNRNVVTQAYLNENLADMASDCLSGMR